MVLRRKEQMQKYIVRQLLNSSQPKQVGTGYPSPSPLHKQGAGAQSVNKAPYSSAAKTWPDLRPVACRTSIKEWVMATPSQCPLANCGSGHA